MKQLIYRRNDINTDAFILKLGLFVLCPFVAFLYSLKEPTKYSSYLIFFLAGLLFSWSIYYKDYTHYIDFIGVASSFYATGILEFSDIIESYKGLWDDSGGNVRSYGLLIIWLTRLFSENFHLMFVIASIPFLTCMLKSTSTLTSDSKFNNSIYAILILFLFVLPKDLFNIQNFRFSTATWMLVLGCIKIFQYAKQKYIILILITPLIHSSFFVITAIVLFYHIIINRFPKLITTCFYLSIPFAFLSVDFFAVSNFSFLPSALQEWGESYLSEEAKANWGGYQFLRGSGFFWVSAIFYVLRTGAYLAIPFFILREIKRNKVGTSSQKMFYFYLFFFSIVNVIQSVPVLGTRFWGISRIWAVFVWFKIMYPRYSKFILLLLVSCVAELYNEVFPHYMRVLDLDFFFSNLFSLVIKHWGVTSY